MSFAKEIEEAQRVYKDILNGFSVIEFEEETLYVKHLSDLDHGWIQEYKKNCYSQAKKRGVLTEEQKIDSLIEQELWSRKKSERVSSLLEEVANLTTTKRKLVLKSQIKQIQKNIDELEKELNELTQEKAELIGVTCENYADKKVNERYIFYCLFKDEELKEQKYTEEEFDELEENTLIKIISINNNKLAEMGQDNIKKISACPFFLNSLMICKNNPFTFFGKPVVKLTNFQQELFSTGQRYRSVIENSGKIPPDSTSLKAMVSWYEDTIIGESSKTKGGENTSGQTVFGADKEELKALTASADDGRAVVDLNEKADQMLKEGGKEKSHLDFNEILKLHGEI